MVKYNSFPRRCHPFLIWLLKFKNLQCVLTKFSEFSMSSFCQTRRNLQHVRSTRLFFYLMQICLFYPILRLCQLPSTELIFFFKKKKKKKTCTIIPSFSKVWNSDPGRVAISLIFCRDIHCNTPNLNKQIRKQKLLISMWHYYIRDELSQRNIFFLLET
jgi:hypothetical protein